MTEEKKKVRAYAEDDITGFTRDLEKIQAKPTLYIGPTDDAGVFTVLRECLDNAVDEARAGRNDWVYVNVEGERGPFWVVDHGVGIPVGMHKKMKISTMTHVLTNLQSSGKMKVGGAYASAIGTHGVGIKATNALAESMEVWTYRKDAGGWHYTKFERGIEKVKVKKVKDGPKVPGLKRQPDSGTVICFTPDPKVFGKHKLQIKALARWARMTSYMNAGLRIKLRADGKEKEFYAKDGIKTYLAERIESLKATMFSKKIIFHNSSTLEMALAFTDVEGAQVEFFTNTVRNVEEGVHADDVYKALFDSLKPFMKVKEPKAKGKKKKKDKGESKYPFTPSDLRDGLVGLVNYKIDAPQFDSQTKEKLVDQRVKGACYAESIDVLNKFWKDNAKLAKDLIARATELRNKTQDFLKDKKLLKNVNAARKAISAKLAGVVGSTPVEERELFLVEGDSAGGGCKRARDRSFQAIYPLRGKPINVLDNKKEKINNNAEVTGLLAALDINLNDAAKDKQPKAKYGKIITMADPDVDGKHINCLCLAILWRYTPHLVRNGNVFVVKAPLYKCTYKGKTYFGMSKDEIYKQTGTEKCDMSYIKGWGEVNEEDLKVALDPKVRVLYKVAPPVEKGRFELILSSTQYRKKLFNVQ